jgi:outer membrane protein TolC
MLIAAIALSVAAPAAQDLDSLTAIALRENARLLALDAAYHGARAQVAPAGALPDPMLSYRFEGAPLANPSPAEAMENRVELEQMLPFPGKQGLMKSMAEGEAAMAGAQLAQARLEVAADLRRAYYDLDLARASIAILQESLAALAAMVENARTRYEVGRGMQSDMLKASVEQAMEQARLAVMRQRLPAQRARVNAILNRAPGAPLETSLPDSLGPAESVPADSAELEARALQAQPMVRMRSAAVTRSEYGLSLAQREGWPDFTVAAGYMGMKDAPDAWMGMLGINLPIWRWNKVGPQREAAEEAKRQALAELEQTRNDTHRLLREAWAGVAAARAMLQLYEEAVVPQAQLSWDSAQAAYQTGALGFLDLLDAQRSLLQARLQHHEALAEYRKSRAELGLAAGDAAMLGIGAPEEGTGHE